MALGPFYVAEKLRQSDGVRGVALLMRHGETAWNRQGRVMGRNPVELDEHGRAQVTAAIELLRSVRPELIVSSPLIRARQSAQIIADGLGDVPILEEPLIAEVQYGRWEGMSYHELITDADYLSYREEPIHSPTPGGETIPEVQARGVEAVTRALKQNEGGRVLFVSHGDIIRTVLCHFMGMELHHFRRIRVDNAALSAVQIAGDFAEIKFLNLLPDLGRAFVAPFPIKKSE
ncbi:MAG TPA: histidine phosphatase family protein [Candidatus Binataceae bacterium]|jgi:broad specificity phosphatase PhoE|nr:histidine phosphatase family protein [Candidatus Binataceae bacterium]